MRTCPPEFIYHQLSNAAPTMNWLLILYFLVTAIALPFEDVIPFDQDGPTKEEGASVARTLVNRESLASVSTIKTWKLKDGETKQLPVVNMEYYADCDEDGDPYWLVIDVGGANQNIIKGLPFSFAIRDGDHPDWEKVPSNYPGKREGSNAGSPRVQLTGRLEYVNFFNPLDPRRLNLERCFVKRHPDSTLWLPGSIVSPHKSHWVKLKVEGVYIIGGFGDTAYIGDIEPELYHAAEIIPPSDDDEGRGK